MSGQPQPSSALGGVKFDHSKSDSTHDEKVAIENVDVEAGTNAPRVTLDASRPYPHGNRVTTMDATRPYPRVGTRNSARIPVEYRTLSIHVYDTQQQSMRVPTKRPEDVVAAKDKTGANASAEDAQFFANLDYHTLEAEVVAKRVETSIAKGLDGATVRARQDQHGKNVLAKRKSQYWKKLIRYFFGDFCSILWIGVIVFFLSWKPLGNPPAPYNLALAIVVIIVIIFQALFSAFQDYSTQKVMDSILDLLPAEAVVLRDGQLQTIHSSDIVPGDIVHLSTGNKVPADMRLIKTSSDVRFDRSVLTGEPEEIPGFGEATKESNFLEAKNVALLGTHVRNGTAVGIVLLTGPNTVMGRINKLTNDTKEKPTLIQQEISRFVKIIICLTVSLVVIMLVVWLAWLRKDHFAYLNVVGILTNLMGLVVAFIPEGMPVAVALTLSIIARRMKAVNVLPKSLATVETLGCVNVICSDKTGTLTENKMSVVAVGTADQEIPIDHSSTHLNKAGTWTQPLVEAMAVCNDAFFEEDQLQIDLNDESKAATATPEPRKVNGNATDAAMLRLADSSLDVSAIREERTRIAGIPFNSKNKWMMTLNKNVETSNITLYVKGGPDVLMPHCTTYLSAKGPQPLSMEAVVTLQEKWSRLGRRVLLLACKDGSALETVNEDDLATKGLCDLMLLGLVGIMDPPRADIPHTVSECRRAGSRFMMVTGDHRLTAAAIGQMVGIFTSEHEPYTLDTMDRAVLYEGDKWLQGGLVLQGTEIDQLTDDDWETVCQFEEVVFSRSTPEQKLRIVREYQDRHQIVAVTGDGVNDSAALKAADVGIAMVNGSDVAIEASDLVLLGNFSSIVDGIRLGRLVFQNLGKTISYLLPAGSYSEDWPVLLSVFLGVPLPLSSFLMIIICCFTDLVCCLTMIMEKEEFDLLSLPPRDARKDHLINFKVYSQAYIWIGTLETVAAHSMYFLYYWRYARIPASSLFLAFEKYTDGFYGYTQAELTQFNAVGQSVYFVTLVILQWGNLLTARNKKMSIFQADPFFRKERRNLWLIPGALFALAIAIFVTMVPGMQSLFGTASIPVEFWFYPLPMAIGILALDEVRKLIVRTWPNGPIARMAW